MTRTTAEARKAILLARAAEVRIVTCKCGYRWIAKMADHSPKPDNLAEGVVVPLGMKAFSCPCGLLIAMPNNFELVWGLGPEY